MTSSNRIAAWMLAGALAGLAGGIVFCLAMWRLGALSSIAELVRAGDSLPIGIAIHLVISAVVGAGFGLLVRHLGHGGGDMLFWGLTYGALWWFIGPLTLMPIILGAGLGWDLHTAQAAFPSLLGHLLYGAATGLTLLAVRRRWLHSLPLGSLLRAALAGLAAAAIVGKTMSDQHRLAAAAALPDSTPDELAWAAWLAIGVGSALALALVTPPRMDGAGVALVRGCMFGFLAWIVLPRTLLPLIGVAELSWSMADARDGFDALMAYLLFGAFLGMFYDWLESLWRALFGDEGTDEDEGVGARGLRSIGRGSLAGIVGGILFTYVMVQVGALRDVANLMRMDVEAVGLVVHFIISCIWGATYGLLFRRQAYDVGSAVGWGISYGFFVWLIGPLTLMPMLLGFTPDWTADTAAGLTASLVGHLAYGAGLGVTFHYFEAKFSPWWIPRRKADAVRAQRRRAQILTSAPALWALVIVVGLTLPIVFGAAP